MKKQPIGIIIKGDGIQGSHEVYLIFGGWRRWVWNHFFYYYVNDLRRYDKQR